LAETGPIWETPANKAGIRVEEARRFPIIERDGLGRPSYLGFMDETAEICEKQQANHLPMERLARVALVAALAIVMAQQAWLIFYINHRTYGEGPILAFLDRMAVEPVSASWLREPPYGLSCYGPAYYWLTDAVARAGGWRHSFIPGRLVAVGCAWLAAALAAVAAGRKTRSLNVGLLAALLFLVSAPAAAWIPFARVDTLALAWAAAAYLAVGPGARRVLIAAVCVAAGSLAKPTTALTAVPIVAHLLAERRYRHAGLFAGAVGGLGIAAWAIVQRASDGFFLSAVLLGNRNPLQLWRGYSFSYEFLASPIGTAATLLAAGSFIAAPRGFARSLFTLGFVLSTAMSIVMVSKRGAELNYFLEPALLAGLALAVDGAGWLRKLNARRSALVMALLATVVALPHLRQLKVDYHAPPRQPAGYAVVERWLADEPADVDILADGRMVDMVLAAGRQPWLNDPYLYSLLVDNGTLNAAPLLDRLRDGRIKWLFLHRTLDYHLASIDRDGHCFPPDVLRALPSRYELVDRANGLFVYRHRRYGEELAAAAGDD
jgi:hypothetical protein